jgi:hypothetical protein
MVNKPPGACAAAATAPANSTKQAKPSRFIARSLTEFAALTNAVVANPRGRTPGPVYNKVGERV